MAANGTVLIVDDDFDIRDTLTEILEEEGYTVKSAMDGFEALSYLRANPAPSLILLDWMMPHCDGAQFRSEQRNDPSLARIPVVLLTADTRTYEKTGSLQVDGFLAKPVDLMTLLDVVSKYAG
jgi:CheY-like chemotaxis protein